MPNKIRGAVFSRYESISNFAEAIGWGRQKASRIISGKQRPTAEDMEKMASCLGIKDAADFMVIFFPNESTK